jgi:glycosyltransferase involved in cell wall biosynthesis
VTEADVVVSLGHDALHKLMGSAIARALGRPLLYVADTNIVDVAEAVSASLPALGLLAAKRLLLGALFQRSLTLGKSNELALRLVGVEVCHPLPLYAVEFSDEAGNLPADLAERIEALDSPRLLCTARLVPQKNLVNLARAFARYAASGGRGSLCCVGDGPLKTHVERELSALADNRYLVAGALKYEASRGLARRFDGTILPSTSEPWGIVVIESLGEATPVLASQCVGAAVSLRLEPGAQHAVELCGTSPAQLEEGIGRFVERLAELQRVARERAPSIRARFGIEPVAASLVSLGRDVMDKPDWTGA